MCAFGGLADGFLPFPLPGGGTAELKLASVVMKAVQARGPSPQELPNPHQIPEINR